MDLIIDADSHVTEPPDVWTARVPAKYRGDVPRVEQQGTSDTWVLDGKRLAPVGVTAPAGWPTFPPNYPQTYEDCHPGAVPECGGVRQREHPETQDDALKLLCVSAYNDFLLEWSSADLRRLLRIMATPFWDIEATVREIERCIPLGARGILFTGEPQR